VGAEGRLSMPRDASRYVVDGIRLPSVTECLDAAGFTDFGAVPPRVLARAAERGSDFHEWRDALDAGLIDADMIPPQSIALRVAAYVQFKADTGFHPERSEEVVIHRALGYAGTFDLVGKMPTGTRFVIDTKAVAAISPATRVQLCGYALAIEAETGEKPDRAALWLRADGTYRFLPYTRSRREDEQNWLAALRCARFRFDNGYVKTKEAA
jgi:hypothetical protein